MTSIATIQQRVAAGFDIPLIDMTSERRSRNIARSRQVAMYLARHLTPYSLPKIGRGFGNRDHTTVMHAVTRVTALMSEDPAFRARVLAISAALQAPVEEV